MREIQKDALLDYINSIKSPVVCENIIHVFFQRLGRERDVEVDNRDEKRICDSH